jgi:hypothetical protein
VRVGAGGGGLAAPWQIGSLGSEGASARRELPGWSIPSPDTIAGGWGWRASPTSIDKPHQQVPSASPIIMSHASGDCVPSDGDCAQGFDFACPPLPFPGRRFLGWGPRGRTLDRGRHPLFAEWHDEQGEAVKSLGKQAREIRSLSQLAGLRHLRFRHGQGS